VTSNKHNVIYTYATMHSSNLNNRCREILDQEKFISLVMTEFQNNEINRIKYYVVFYKLAYMVLPIIIK
jgi:hypothetical protein